MSAPVRSTSNTRNEQMYASTRVLKAYTSVQDSQTANEIYIGKNFVQYKHEVSELRRIYYEIQRNDNDVFPSSKFEYEYGHVRCQLPYGTGTGTSYVQCCYFTRIQYGTSTVGLRVLSRVSNLAGSARAETAK
eukprot:scaffold54659_cov21-Prasinocladus_malaysianus.AAC.1